MPFEGDLRLVSLESVLRNIDANSLSGVLTIKDARGERKVAFQSGRIVAFLPVTGEERLVTDALAKKGLIAKEEAEKVRTSLAWKRMNLRRALEYRGLVKELEYVQAVRDEVIVPYFLELFQCRERTFRFDEKPLEHTPSHREPWDHDQLAAELKVTIESVVLECVKRLQGSHEAAAKPADAAGAAGGA